MGVPIGVALLVGALYLGGWGVVAGSKALYHEGGKLVHLVGHRVVHHPFGKPDLNEKKSQTTPKPITISSEECNY